MPVHGERVQVGGLFGDDSNCNGQNGIIVEWSNDRGKVRIETGYNGQVGKVVHVQQSNLYPYSQTVDMTSGIQSARSSARVPTIGGLRGYDGATVMDMMDHRAQRRQHPYGGRPSSYRAGADPAFEEWATRQGYSHLLPSPDSELPTRVAMPVQDSELPTRVAMPVHGERVQVGGLFGDDSNCNGQNGIIVEWSNDRGTVRIETGYSGQVGRVVHVQQTNLYPYGQTVNLYPYGQTVDMTSGILLEQSTGARPPAAAAATSLPPSAASSGKASKAKITSSYEPPPPVQMRSRLCALNFDLIRDMKAKFHNRPIPAGEITKWFKSNPQQLDGTGISIDQISTDHIIPKSVGGYDHLFNYYIMPKGHNSHFKDNWTPEKKAYVGKQGVKIAQGFSQWCKDKATPDLQFFNFKPDNYLL